MTRPSRLLAASSVGRAAAEFALIVTGILLALWIDGWVESRREAALERHYLGLLVRDLDATVAGLDRFVALNTAVRAAGIDAYRMLHEDPAELDADLLASKLYATAQRITPRLPRAAYTELLSSGGLRLIRDPDLRDAVMQFYEESERLFTVLEKNATGAVDGTMNQKLFDEGLVYPPFANMGEAYERILVEDPGPGILEELGPEFRPEPHLLTSLPRNAPQWASLRTSVFKAIRAADSAVQVGGGLIRANAVALRGRLAESLGPEPENGS